MKTNTPPRPGTPRASTCRSRLAHSFLRGTWKAFAAALLASTLPIAAQTAQPTNVESLVADFNHDGIPDLLALSPTSATGTIAFGTIPFGTFSPTPKVAIAPPGCVGPSNGAINLGNLVIADFNNDGIPDYFFACDNSTTAQTTISGVMLGNGDATFTPSATLNAPYTAGGVAGDFDHDGKLDLVLITYPNGLSGTATQTPALLLFSGKGDGTFAAPISSPLGASATFQPGNYLLSSPVATDIDGDGYPDILLNAAYGYTQTSYTGATLVIAAFGNRKDGTFGVLSQGARTPDATARVGSYPAANPLKLLAGHFISPTVFDFVVPDTGTSPGLLFIANTSTPGAFSLATRVKTVSAGLKSAAIASFTGSGLMDLAVANGSTVSALNTNQDGTFTAAFPSLSVTSAATVFSMADANGDGYTDLYTASILNSTLSVSVNLVTGSASATTAPFSLPRGSAALSAAWPGNVNFNGSTATGNQTVNGISTTSSIASSKNPSTTSEAVTFTAVVSPSSSATSAPTGSVDFTEGAATLGTGTLDITGTATFTTTALPAATHSLRAVYRGDSTFEPSSSTLLIQVVNQPPATAPTLTWSPAPVTVGTALSTTQLNAAATNGTGTAIPGTYVYTPPAGTILSTVGSQVLSVIFTPADLVSYKPASLSVPISVLPATQTPLTTNLLLNPGAELGLVSGAIPNWTPAGDGSPSLDSGTFDSSITPHTGMYDFLGTNGAADSLSQTVSLLTQGITSTLIDSGSVSASLSFWEQGLSQGTPSDDATVTLSFLDTSGTTLSSVTTAEADSHDGTWQNLTGSYPIPGGTRSITYTISFIRHAGSDLDAFVDDNSLILTTIQAAAPTTTTLAIAPITTVAQGTPITLTATVLAGATSIAPGQVKFCDAASPSCTDIHLLGTAQLTASGTATLKLIPSPGAHTYRAVFLGTTSYATSISTTSSIAVTGHYATTTSLTSTGTTGNYTLTATTAGPSLQFPPTGLISFVDQSRSNAVLAQASLGDSALALSLAQGSATATGTEPATAAQADFNGDGRPDLIIVNNPRTIGAAANKPTILLTNADGTFNATLGPDLLNSSVVTADFNGDGKADFAGPASSGGISVFLGNGDGTFGPAVTSATPFNAANMVSADLNSDGIADLAVLSFDTQSAATSLTVLLGKGNGTFTAGTTTALTGTGSYAIASVDLNADGRPDLILTGAYQSSSTSPTIYAASILLGKGDGTFTAQPNVTSTNSMQNTLAADFNGDGKVDLVFTSPAQDGSVTLNTFLGKGDGTFTPQDPATLPNTTGAHLTSAAIADFNADGLPDIAIATYPQIAILLNDGHAIFTPAASITRGDSTPDYLPIVVADFNGDGTPDIFTTDSDNLQASLTLTQASASASAIANNISPLGAGVHQIIASYPGNTLYAASTSDPLTLAGQTVTSNLIWTPTPATIPYGTPLGPQQLNATATTPSGQAVPGTYIYTPAAGTILPVGSQLLSVIFTPTDTATYTSATATVSITVQQAPSPSLALSIASGNSTSTSVPSGTVITLTATALAGTTPITPGQVNFCDTSATTCTDVHLLGTAQLTAAGTATIRFIPAIGTHAYKAVFLGTPTAVAVASATKALTVTGKYSTTTSTTQSGTRGNYTLTAAIIGNGPAPPTGSVSILDSTNAGSVLATATLTPTSITSSFAAQIAIATGGGPIGVTPVDLNNDGKADLLVNNAASSNLSVLLGLGDGTFSLSPNVATGRYPSSVAVGDFNADGKPDAAVTNFLDSTVSILLGKGDGTFTLAATFDSGLDSRTVTTADFNRDGKLDLAIGHDNSVTILLGNGDGTFAATTNPAATGNGPNYSLTSADFNGDGLPDIAVTNTSDNAISILLGNGDGSFTAKSSPATGSTPVSLAAGDLNGDGKLDIAVANQADNTVSILLGNGDGTFTLGTSPSVGNNPQGVSIGDLDGDGIADLAVANQDSNTVSILHGKGDGTFTLIASPATGASPDRAAIADFNGDGIADLATSNVSAGGVSILLTRIANTSTATATHVNPVGTGDHQIVASYPGDTLSASSDSNPIALSAQPLTPTLAWTPTVPTIAYGTPLGTSQLNAVATTSAGVLIPGIYTYTPGSDAILTAGTQTLSLTFTSTSTLYAPVNATQTITVTRATPTLAWSSPSPIPQGTPISSTQLNAIATAVNGAALPGTFTYTPANGTVLVAGTQTLSTTFTPTDLLNYTAAIASVRITVTGLTLTSIAPSTANLGDAAKAITLTGTGFTTSSVVQVNGASIPTIFVNATTLTAIVPATNFTTVGVLTITVISPATSSRSQALPFTVLAPAPSVTLTGPGTTQPGTQPTLALAITNPYPVPLTATFTLTFASTVTPVVDDPAIQFANGGRTFTFTVAANSTTVPSVQLQAGTIAGTITIPLALTAAGVNVTPATLQPVTIVIPATVPAVTTASITRGAGTFTVTVHGFSNTREVTTAAFHFLPATGAQIDTPDVIIPVGTIFSGWFTSTPSVSYGSTFTYTQVFNVSDTAANIGSVQVILTNAVGVSTTYTAQ